MYTFYYSACQVGCSYNQYHENLNRNYSIYLNSTLNDNDIIDQLYVGLNEDNTTNTTYLFEQLRYLCNNNNNCSGFQ